MSELNGEEPRGVEMLEGSYDHISAKELRKKWSILIEPLDRGYIVTIGCKKIAFVNYQDVVSSLKEFYSDPHNTANKWKEMFF